MSVLVAGAAGFIGGNVVRILHERGEQPIGFDVGRVGPNSVLWDVKDEIPWVTGTIVDLSQLLRVAQEYKVDGIINTAAQLGDANNQRPVDGVRVNVEGTVNVLEAARILGLRRVVCCSSGTAAGAHTDLTRAVKEDDPPVVPQTNIYAVLKLACEGLVYNYQHLFGVSAVCVRPSRVYGPGSAPHRGERHPIQFLTAQAVNGQNVNLESGADTLVDYTYVKDEAEGIILAYQAESPSYTLYNLSYGALRSPRQMAEVLRPLFPEWSCTLGPGLWPGWIPSMEQSGPAWQFGVRPPFDVSRAKSDLGYVPHDIDSALPDYVRWLRDREYALPEDM
jgi:UDP-glucose 4-epimerase